MICPGEIAAGHVGIEEAIKKLKKIDKMPVKRIPYQIAAAGLSAGGLGYLLGGTAMEAFVAIFCRLCCVLMVSFLPENTVFQRS